MFGTVTLTRLRASVINTTLGQDSDWTQSVTKELVTNKLLTAITYNTCESQSQDQDSPVPELSATTITNSLVLWKPTILVRIFITGPSSPVI